MLIEFLFVLVQFSGTFTKLWNITGTHISSGRRDSAVESYAQGSMIPGANYSAQDDHSGVQVAGM